MSPTVTLGDIGALVQSTDIDGALIQVLKKWMPTFLRVEAEKRALEVVPPAPSGASYNNPLDLTEWTDVNFPGIIVATAKTQGLPKRNSDGTYRARWLSRVSAVVRGTRGIETRDRAALYEGAVRRSLGHTAALTDIMSTVQDIRWTGVEIAPVTPVGRAGRYLAAGMSTFIVTTDRAFQDSAGPTVPDPAPPAAPQTYVPIGTVTEIDLTTEALNKDGNPVGPVTDHITSGG